VNNANSLTDSVSTCTLHAAVRSGRPFVLELLNSKKTTAAVTAQLSALQAEVNAHTGLNASGAVVVSHMKMVDRSVYSQIQASVLAVIYCTGAIT
jgi:hypothetical protein